MTAADRLLEEVISQIASVAPPYTEVTDDMARVALSVAIEACAKVADADSVGNDEEYDYFDQGRVVAARRISERIRALKPKD